MNTSPEDLPAPGEAPAQAIASSLQPAHVASFFQPIDWLSFAITTALVFAVYLFTLAPEVTLDMSGELSAGATYGGVGHPPGYPFWSIYAWLFTKLPFSNMAWC